MQENTKKTNSSSVITLAEGFITLLFLGLIYAWSIFRAPLQILFPEWTVTQMSITFTISMICFCLGGFVSGKIANIISHRIVLFCSAVICLVGFVMIFLLLEPGSSSKSLITLYIFYGVFCGTAVGFSYNTILGVVVRRFQGKAGTASGILLLGFGIGGMLLGQIVLQLIDALDINKTFLILGILLAVILSIAAIALKKPEMQKVSANDVDEAPVLEGKSLSEAATKPTFWAFFVWGVFINIGGLLIINSAVPIAMRFGMIAVMGLVVSVFNGIGRPLIGMILDSLGRKRTMMLNSLILIVAGILLLCGALTENSIFIYIGLPLVGIAYGGAPTTMSAVTNNFYGIKHYQVIFATLTFSVAVSAILGPIISSELQETSGGEYLTSFIMVIVVGVMAFLLSIIMTSLAKKENLE